MSTPRFSSASDAGFSAAFRENFCSELARSTSLRSRDAGQTALRWLQTALPEKTLSEWKEAFHREVAELIREGRVVKRQDANGEMWLDKTSRTLPNVKTETGSPASTAPSAPGAMTPYTAEQFEDFKGVFINELAKTTWTGVKEADFTTKLLPELRRIIPDLSLDHDQGSKAKYALQHAVVHQLVSEGKLERFHEKHSSIPMYRKTFRTQDNVKTEARAPTASQNTLATNAYVGTRVNEREWKKVILDIVDGRPDAKVWIRTSELQVLTQKRIPPPNFNSRDFIAAVTALVRSKVLSLGTQKGHQLVRRVQEAAPARPAGQVETIDLTSDTPSQPRMASSHASSSRALPWPTSSGKHPSANTNTSGYRSTGTPVYGQGRSGQPSSRDPTFSDTKQEWTRRRLRHMVGYDSKKLFEVLRLIVPSLRTVERRNLMVEDISLEVLRKCYRYLQHCELEAGNQAQAQSALMQQPLHVRVAAQDAPPQDQVERAILGATNKQLCDTLLELCKSSSALSRAVIRALEPGSDFATKTLQDGASGTQHVKREPNDQGATLPLIKPDPGVKPEPSDGPTTSSNAPRGGSAFGQSSTPRLSGTEQPPGPSKSTDLREPAATPSSTFRPPPVVMDLDSDSDSNNNNDVSTHKTTPNTTGTLSTSANKNDSTNNNDTSDSSSATAAHTPAEGTSSTGATPLPAKRRASLVKCTRCMNRFDPTDNRRTDCKRHPGTMQVEDLDADDEAWSCCGNPRGHPGCVRCEHRAPGEEEAGDRDEEEEHGKGADRDKEEVGDEFEDEDEDDDSFAHAVRIGAHRSSRNNSRYDMPGHEDSGPESWDGGGHDEKEIEDTAMGGVEQG